jgi:osmoprotectant transport system substrate-binding protein
MPRPRFFSFLMLATLTLGLMLSLSTCGQPQTQVPIRVGSKDFTEQLILGEMYAQILEGAGLPVERKLNLGGTPVAQAGLLNGDIDLYPEYTGTGLVTVLKLPVPKDAAVTAYPIVAGAYRQKFKLVWLQPAPMNNSQALVVTRETADRLGLQTISQLVPQTQSLTLIGPPEFAAREDGLPGLRRVYGDFQFKQFIPVDSGLRYQALLSGQADVAVGFATDGEIAASKLVVLKDDRQLFPPYQVAPVVRQQTLTAYPQVRGLLDALAPKLTDEVMQQLNFAVSGKQQEPAAVAREFLAKVGLLARSSQ